MPAKTNVALVVFIVIVIANACGLLLDALLWLLGMETMTEYYRAHPFWGIVVVCLQVIGALALTAHFWWRN